MSKSRLTIAALLVAVWRMATAAQQPASLGAADTARIKKEVTDAVDKYYSLFTAQDMKALPEQVYSTPWILMTARGPEADLTKEQAQTRFETSLKGLLESGWANRSSRPRTSAC